MTLYLASRNPIVPDYPPIVQNASPGKSDDGAEQQFEVRDVSPGKYELFAVLSSPSLTETAAVARIPFEVGGRNLEGLVGVAELPKTLQGKVVPKVPGMRLETTTAFLQPLKNMPSALTVRTGVINVAPDGTFVVDGIYPATYLVVSRGPFQ